MLRVGLLSLVLILPSPAHAVERETDGEAEPKAQQAAPAAKVGYEAESDLKHEPASKSYFFLTNDIQWPEKMELAPLPKPAPPTPQAEPAPIEQKRPRPRPKPEPELEPEPAGPDTAMAETPVRTTVTKLPIAQADRDKRKKPPVTRKPAVAMPDIEKLLADVRRSAQPKMPADAGAPPSGSAPKPPADLTPYRSEVEGVVDIDALARDLEKLQTEAPAAGAAAAKISPPKQAGEKPAGSDGWTISAAVTATAAALYYAISVAIRRRRKHIRPQSHIDAETRAFFDKLIAEQRRRAAARESAKPAPAPAPAPAPPGETIPAEVQDEETLVPEVFLLPPELAEGAYKEAVKLAAMGETPHDISEKLNLGEGEVRLVLDIARLTHQRMQAA
ncbi:MAG: hypothetical protein A3G34_04305 [Candidatus Lindowbacteria bacterium RIFCSPLOWO2_12_FULL_62_27]|nr:MAG: hypothetical protein A3G34_04305 [Candidatus Lindowbacteria bacterium RIFCSPLOWO2_12_FULL_62_27]OGH63775.1 MAG: hypothetical protein A3I06_12690 [Candidatus Lindowbacteria bacterium RIFCSPLOWO2_02_FULL_62_12]